MDLPLTLTIDRTEDGHFRAEVAGHPETAVEGDDVVALVAGLVEERVILAGMPDRRALLRLAESNPVPAEWRDEPGWDDVP